MYKRILAVFFLLLQNIPVVGMDLNQTIVIITEATEATQVLQSEFDTLIYEVTVPPNKKEIVELNSTIQVNELIETSHITENNTSNFIINEERFDVMLEINESIEINSSILLKELNSSKNLSCKESNRSILINGLDINLDDNNTISDNGCTDANLGTSAEGLRIFKTRIRPYCAITGDKFAKQYMQEDWDDIYHDKEFKMEIIKACPKMEERYKDKWTPHLYQFTLEYASDSDAIPEC